MKSIFVCMLAVLILSSSYGQSDITLEKILHTTNLQKTANTKDILSTLFRSSLDNLLGDAHSFTLNSTFYGIDSIFRGKNAHTMTYEQERKSRQRSFDLSLTGDSVNNIIKFSGGFTISLMNKKDITLNKIEPSDKKLLDKAESLMAVLFRAVQESITQKYKANYTGELKTAIKKTWNDADQYEDYSNLHPYIKVALSSGRLAVLVLGDTTNTFEAIEIEEAAAALLKDQNPAKKIFKAIGERFSRKALWTITPTATYDKLNDQGEYSLASAFTVGIGSNLDRKPWELEVKSQFRISNDTSFQTANYDNKPFFISIGLNKVLMETEDKEPTMEFKFFTQYDHQFGTVPTGTEQGVFSLNSTLRIKVFKSLWLPVTIKYDPENNNFLGLFSITAHIGN
ncbi:MAG TPA: hypothetical protein VMZ03_06575 [Chitinophagaceae bacterium]|nr:hypothetical protein [Chitinophagaceae bacterium]